MRAQPSPGGPDCSVHGPPPSSSRESPADPRPLGNVIHGAARPRPCPRCCRPSPAHSTQKRTRARIATLIPSMPPARLRPAPCIPGWQARPSVPWTELQSSLDKLTNCTRSPPTRKIKKKIRIFFFARRQVRKLYPSPAQPLGGASRPLNGLLTPRTPPPRPPPSTPICRVKDRHGS